MISCSEFEILLSAQLDDELTQAERVQLDAHLENCAHCRALQADLSYLHRETAMLSTPVPKTLTIQILETLQTVALPPSKRKHHAKHLVAAAMILLLGGALWSHRPPTTPPSIAPFGQVYDNCEIAASAPKAFIPESRTFCAAGGAAMDTIQASPLLTQKEAMAQLMAWFDGIALPEGMNYFGFSLLEQSYVFRWNTDEGTNKFYSVSAFDGTVTERAYTPLACIFHDKEIAFLPFY